jgi:predicted short-subunit dehydrogenase-like oxidoreductase (DUF2520 family)
LGADMKRVAIIGVGRVGTAMASLLSARGYDVVRVVDVSADARDRAAGFCGAEAVEDPVEAAGAADIVLITTPDDAIEETCRRIADSMSELSGKKFIHMSGALSLGVLSAAERRGADTLSVHPLQTFADLTGALESLPGSTFGVTCAPGLEDWGAGFVSALGGRAQIIEDGDKVLYHAAAVMACNLLVMVEYGAQSIARELGFSDSGFAEAFLPLARATLENVGRLGPAGALTGPLARGDLGTISGHLEALARFDPVLASMYRSVCLWGLELVGERGDTEDQTIEAMRRLLG